MLSLLAVFVLGAVASASASAAAPEFWHCPPKVGGAWMAGCKVTGTTHEKEVVPAGSKIKFESISEPSYLFANPAGTYQIRCGKDTVTGEITGPKAVSKVKVTFTECKGYKGAEECTVKSIAPSPVGVAGEIKTNELSGELGLVAAAEAPSSETGLAFKPTTGTSFVLLIGSATTCIPESNVTGSVIGEVEPVKIMDTTGELIFGVKGGKNEHNVQTIQKIVGVAKDTLTAFVTEVGLESEDSITFEEPIEVT
jgi:hypothetical protein